MSRHGACFVADSVCCVDKSNNVAQAAGEHCYFAVVKIAMHFFLKLLQEEVFFLYVWLVCMSVRCCVDGLLVKV